MRNRSIKQGLFLTFLICLTANSLMAQDQNLNVRQDAKFQQLLSERRKISSSATVNERYKIQIFSGDSEKAKSELYICKQQFRELDGTIVFNTPNYKVWIGNFRTRIEAERNLVELRKSYSNAFLIKPQK
ncbi:SPOR domain-containing protein [Flavobacterium frigidarium]|uniref:SPOR domain-containing protein n=1 Tax=Flavobacterium frigidarium TaxID=99286 RepID=UPI00047C4219|nr:SPOR domain-containing protein [Flavobacterium frigidarium]